MRNRRRSALGPRCDRRECIRLLGLAAGAVATGCVSGCEVRGPVASDLPEAYREAVLDYLHRAGEFSAGGLELATVAIREGPVIDSPEDGLFKFRLSDSLPEDAVTLVKSNTSVISGSSTTFRPGLQGSRLRDVAGHEVLTSWGAIGTSPNGGLMDPGTRPEDPRDIPMVSIAYRLEAGYVWA